MWGNPSIYCNGPRQSFIHLISIQNLTFCCSIVILNLKKDDVWRRWEMAERDPIDLIREQLNRVDVMAGLHPDHQTFKDWHNETKTILEKAFSFKSIHYQNFLALRFREMSFKAFSSPEIDKINSARYKKDLESAKSIFQSAIKELTLDRTLFKKIQTTPKAVEVSVKGEYFISSGILETEKIRAIESAFLGTGLNPIYGIEAVQKGEPLQYRINQIKSARFGIYDLSSSEKPDTIVELGIALGLGRQISIIHKKGSPLPEMVKELNTIEYEDPSDLIEKLKKKIKF